jgi:hypothetical protein
MSGEPVGVAPDIVAAGPACDNDRKEVVLVDTSLAGYAGLVAGVRDFPNID